MLLAGHDAYMACNCHWCSEGPPFQAAVSECEESVQRGLARPMILGHFKSSCMDAHSSILQKVSDKDRPDEAFTTDRAVRAGRANAASGRIMVTIPGDHFGPIPPEADPRGQVCTAMPGW